MDKTRRAKLELANKIADFRNLFCNIFSDVKIKQPGKGIAIAEGLNAKLGTVKLKSGSVFVDNVLVTEKTKIFFSHKGLPTLCDTRGLLSYRTIPKVGFEIKSSSYEDYSDVDYLIVEGI